MQAALRMQVVDGMAVSVRWRRREYSADYADNRSISAMAAAGAFGLKPLIM